MIIKSSILLLTAIGLTACSFKPIEPWVAPYEREHLADPIMDPDRDAVFSSFRQHVFETREGAKGAGSAQGSGCGCN
ncbi:MAG: DUF4266 domain-containing protein [Gammaproteobacteria bacterium]|nr:DUF4266 domain-containing protein [Gammaproteobacteria bacterium]